MPPILVSKIYPKEVSSNGVSKGFIDKFHP